MILCVDSHYGMDDQKPQKPPCESGVREVNIRQLCTIGCRFTPCIHTMDIHSQLDIDIRFILVLKWGSINTPLGGQTKARGGCNRCWSFSKSGDFRMTSSKPMRGLSYFFLLDIAKRYAFCH